MSEDVSGSAAKVLSEALTRGQTMVTVEQNDLVTTLAAVGPDGEINYQSFDTSQTAPRPLRKTGVQSVHDAAAFVAYVNRHALPETEVWADYTTNTLKAVFNADQPEGDTEHTGGQAGWGDHGCKLVLQRTPEWQKWANGQGLKTQLVFAEHVEDRLADFKTPPAADMLEIAQTFQAKRNVEFESGKRLKSGETNLVFQETDTTRAGQKGDLDVPDEFTLGIVLFEGGQPQEVRCRLRYRINDGALSIGYQLVGKDDLERDGFGGVVAAVAEGITQPIWSGPVR